MTEPEPTESAGNGDAADEQATPQSDGDAIGEGGASDRDAPETEESVDVDIDGTVDEELLQRVETTDATALAREIATLELEIDGLQTELERIEEEKEEVTSKLKRKQADFENYKKRMQRRQEEERKRATEDLLERFLAVRDNLQRAVDQDADVDIREGVESTLRQFDDVLESEDVRPIEPEPGAEVDPHRHEVLARVDAGVPEGTVADVHRPGFELGESVLRAAQVTVSEGPAESPDDEDATEARDSGEDSDEARAAE